MTKTLYRTLAEIQLVSEDLTCNGKGLFKMDDIIIYSEVTINGVGHFCIQLNKEMVVN